MTQSITDKLYILVLKGNVRIWLNKKEFEGAKESIRQEIAFIEIGGKIISKDAILYIVPRAELDEAEKIKRGEWKCKFDKWHERNQECGHML